MEVDWNSLWTTVIFMTAQQYKYGYMENLHWENLYKNNIQQLKLPYMLKENFGHARWIHEKAKNVLVQIHTMMPEILWII